MLSRGATLSLSKDGWNVKLGWSVTLRSGFSLIAAAYIVHAESQPIPVANHTTSLVVTAAALDRDPSGIVSIHITLLDRGEKSVSGYGTLIWRYNSDSAFLSAFKGLQSWRSV